MSAPPNTPATDRLESEPAADEHGRSAWARALGAAFVALVSTVYGGTLIAARFGYQASADANYHFAVAREIARGNFRSEAAPHLPWTILSELPVDHYFGFHLLLAPFALLPNPLWGMKLATLLLFVAVPLSVYWLMLKCHAQAAWAWAFAPIVFANQDWRYLMMRGGNWTVLLSLAFIWVAFFVERPVPRRLGIVGLGYLATLSYQGGLVLLPLHLAGLLSGFLLCRERLARARWIEPAFTALGLALGFTLNPYMTASAAPFRFAWFHIPLMNLDPAGLYPGLREFGPVPLGHLLANPEFIVAPCVVLLGVAFVVVRALRGQRPSYEQAVLLGVACLGLALAVRAIRMREYAVPWAVVFLALLTPPLPVRRWLRSALTPVVGLCIVLLLLEKWPDSAVLMGGSLPTAEYRGAGPLLRAYRGPPVLNIAEGDYTTLRYEDLDVAAVQGLSHYFLYPNRPVFADVTTIRESTSSVARLEALLRFYDRGVRLVTVQHRNSAYALLQRYAGAFRPVFRSPLPESEQAVGATIYVIDRAGLTAAIAGAR